MLELEGILEDAGGVEPVAGRIGSTKCNASAAEFLQAEGDSSVYVGVGHDEGGRDGCGDETGGNLPLGSVAVYSRPVPPYFTKVTKRNNKIRSLNHFPPPLHPFQLPTRFGYPGVDRFRTVLSLNIS